MANPVTTPSGDVLLILTRAEALALMELAREGYEKVLRDPNAAQGYFFHQSRLQAAQRVCVALRDIA